MSQEQERETKKLKTPLGRDAEIKTYLTMKEVQELQQVYYKDLEVASDPQGKFNLKGFSGSILIESRNKMIELGVVSYNGSKENILERLLNERPEEYDFLVKEIDKITKDFTMAK